MHQCASFTVYPLSQYYYWPYTVINTWNTLFTWLLDVLHFGLGWLLPVKKKQQQHVSGWQRRLMMTHWQVTEGCFCRLSVCLSSDKPGGFLTTSGSTQGGLIWQRHGRWWMTAWFLQNTNLDFINMRSKPELRASHSPATKTHFCIPNEPTA